MHQRQLILHLLRQQWLDKIERYLIEKEITDYQENMAYHDKELSELDRRYRGR